MRIAHTVEDLIGSTPLVDLSALAGSTARVLGKLEAANPGRTVETIFPAEAGGYVVLSRAGEDGSLRASYLVDGTITLALMALGIGFAKDLTGTLHGTRLDALQVIFLVLLPLLFPEDRLLHGFQLRHRSLAIAHEDGAPFLSQIHRHVPFSALPSSAARQRCPRRRG